MRIELAIWITTTKKAKQKSKITTTAGGECAKPDQCSCMLVPGSHILYKRCIAQGAPP